MQFGSEAKDRPLLIKEESKGLGTEGCFMGIWAGSGKSSRKARVLAGLAEFSRG